MRRSSRGFWLSEVLTALWLITFVGAALIGLFVYLAKSSKLSNERAASDLLADRLIETAVRMGPPEWGLPAGQTGQLLRSPEGHEDRELSYRLDVKLLDEHRLGKLYLLEVTVSWAPVPGTTTNVERGRGTLVRDRQVYVEDFEDEE